MTTKFTCFGIVMIAFFINSNRAENMKIVMHSMERTDLVKITTALSEDEYADKREVRLNEITNKPLQNSSTAIPVENVKKISDLIMFENTTLINEVYTNSSTHQNGELYNFTNVHGVMADSTSGEKVLLTLQMADELTSMTNAVEENESPSESVITELYNITSVWIEANPINKVMETGELELLGETPPSGIARSSNKSNEYCEIIDNCPKEGLDINASCESNRTANSSEPFIVEQKFKVDEANKDFNADKILERYEEIVNNDAESQFKFCKNGKCNDCNNVTIMNSTERPICLTFHNFKEDFEDIRSMERMLQNTTKTSLDDDREVIEKVCFKIQEEQFELVRQDRTTTEYVKKNTTEKKRRKFIRGRKFWPHHKKHQ